MESLSVWALGKGVLLAPGIQLLEETAGEWSVSITKPCQAGAAIVTVPSEMILKSWATGHDRELQEVGEWIELKLQSFPNVQSFLPEFLLALRLIYEVYLDDKSRWHAWLRSLPTTFSTGLYWDSVELSYVERMAGNYLKAQKMQFEAFSQLMYRLVDGNGNDIHSLIPDDFSRWLRHQTNQSNQFHSLLQWAFSIVFTRSWRTPDGKNATIVPLGDMMNHGSPRANLQPNIRASDKALQLCLTRDIPADTVSEQCPSPLYLSYGFGHLPARYLVVFGFCDMSAFYVDAHLEFLEQEHATVENGSNATSFQWASILDPRTMLISTSTGAMTEEVWLAFLYLVLQEEYADKLDYLQQRFGGEDITDEQILEFLDNMLLQHEVKVAMKMKNHYQKLLKADYQEIVVTDQDLRQHPNLPLILNYNMHMRETFMKVISYIDDFMKKAKAIESISSGIEIPISTWGDNDVDQAFHEGKTKSVH